ncbi:Rab-GAP TBC domain-containing protein, variant 3 [Balamuthia mandrillaris]
MDDKACTHCPLCESPFRFYRRRHHCRVCGGVFCYNCSQEQVMVYTKDEGNQLVRVCDLCYVRLDKSGTVMHVLIPDHEMRRWQQIINSWSAFLDPIPNKDAEINLQYKDMILEEEVPPPLRIPLWQTISGTSLLMQSYPEYYYSELLKEEIDKDQEERIMQDLSRTLSEGPAGTIGQSSSSASSAETGTREDSNSNNSNKNNDKILRRVFNVLKAYLVHSTRQASSSETSSSSASSPAESLPITAASLVTSYAQGMNFLVVILVQLADEELAFWLFVQMMSKYYIWGLYQTGTPVLTACLAHFKSMVERIFPRLNNHFGKEGIDVEIFANRWFLTLFSYNFPFAFVLRVWDIFWVEGLDFLVTLALAVLHHYQDKLLSMPYFEVMRFLTSLPEKVIRPQALLNTALGFLLDKEMDNDEEEHRRLHKEEREILD